MTAKRMRTMLDECRIVGPVSTVTVVGSVHYVCLDYALDRERGSLK